MKSHIAMVSLGLSIFYLSGCTPAAKSYWLTYKADPTVAPASIYSGYFKNEPDDLIVACLGLEEQEPKAPVKSSDESNTAYKEREDQYKKSYGEWDARHKQYTSNKNDRVCPNNPTMSKPSLLDSDQAKIAIFRTTPGTPNLTGLECHITQTKITRAPISVFTTAKFDSGQPAVNPSVFVCDLSVTDAGGMRLDYAIRPHTGSEGKKAVNGDAATSRTTIASDLVNDSIEVHTLYRFRVMAGPVYSSLSNKDRTFTAKHHSSGDSFIASDVTGNPVNAVVFLKYYWQPRDVYETEQFWEKTTCPVKKLQQLGEGFCNLVTRINPIVGVKVSGNPLEGVYLGGSFEILNGLDIVGGVNWSSIETLSGGFSQGQIVPANTAIATEKRFLPGWFAGISLDLGVAGSWLGKTTMGILK